MKQLRRGLYETLITRELREQLRRRRDKMTRRLRSLGAPRGPVARA